MAPEVLERHATDARSDLFSFGAILYEMVTGHRAFDGDSDVRAMVSILHTQPKPLRAWRPDLPPELQQIVDGCLAKDPEDRWEAARDVARQIDAIAPSHTTTPLPISSGTLRLYRTQPRWVAAAVMVGAMGAAGTGVLLTRMATVTASPPPHFVALPCHAADQGRQAFCDGFNEALLGRFSRLTLGHRLQVARASAGRQAMSQPSTKREWPARPTSWIPWRTNTALFIRSTTLAGRRRISPSKPRTSWTPRSVRSPGRFACWRSRSVLSNARTSSRSQPNVPTPARLYSRVEDFCARTIPLQSRPHQPRSTRQSRPTLRMHRPMSDPPWFGARDSSATMMSPRQRRRWRGVDSPFRKNRHFPRAIPALG